MRAAAERLFMTTSAVSQQLSLLEKEAGVSLITRSGRRVQLTEAGRVLVRHAHLIAAAAEAAATSMKRFKTNVAGTISISTFPSFASSILPPTLKALRATYPDLRVTTTDLEPFQSVAELRAGRIDLAVIDNLHPVPTEGMITTHLKTDELLICLPPAFSEDLPPGPIPISALSEVDWVTETRQSVFEIFLRRMCLAEGFEPRVIANCSSVDVALALVEAGVGVAVISGMHAIKHSFTGEIRAISPSPTRDIVLAYRTASQDSPLVAAVASELKERAAQKPTAG